MEIEKKMFYTPTELADMFGVRVLCVYRWIKEGRLAANKIGGQWRITEENLQKFITARGYAAKQISPDEARLIDLIRTKGPDRIAKLLDELEAE